MLSLSHLRCKSRTDECASIDLTSAYYAASKTTAMREEALPSRVKMCSSSTSFRSTERSLWPISTLPFMWCNTHMGTLSLWLRTLKSGRVKRRTNHSTGNISPQRRRAWKRSNSKMNSRMGADRMRCPKTLTKAVSISLPHRPSVKPVT